MRTPRVAVVGHVEWVTHARGRLPAQGTIGYFTDPLEEPAGGGAVSVVEAARLGADALFLTALADDRQGAESGARLAAAGVEVRAARRVGGQTRALSVEDGGDRTILVVGERVVPRGDDELPWELLDGCAACYVAGADPGAIAAARRCPVLITSSRRLEELRQSGVRADVVIGSASDPAERVGGPLDPPPDAVVLTDGARGGLVRQAGREWRWRVAPLPAHAVDTYGAGDRFAAGLLVGLGRGLDLRAAVALGAECGARALTVRGGGLG
jgi:ribokinase